MQRNTSYKKMDNRWEASLGRSSKYVGKNKNSHENVFIAKCMRRDTSVHTDTTMTYTREIFAHNGRLIPENKFDLQISHIADRIGLDGGGARDRDSSRLLDVRVVRSRYTSHHL